MPKPMPPSNAHVVLGIGTVVLGSILIRMSSMDKVVESLVFLLFLLSPLLVFSMASQIAKRNIFVRTAVVFGSLFLAFDLVALFSVVGAKATAAIGLGIFIILQLLVALPVLVAAALVGRLGRTRGQSDIV